MKIMQEEIFGPLLPVVEYDEIDEATQLINSKIDHWAFIIWQ